MTAEHQPRTLPMAPGFAGPDAPQEKDLYACVHCGFCLSACPTYLETGLETESPRGRIALMRAVHEGRIPITSAVTSHWSLCLQCRACEVACPSGVPYGRLMQHARAQVQQQRRGSLVGRWLRGLALRSLLPHQGRLAFLARLLRLYQRTGLRRLITTVGLLRLLPYDIASLDASLPDIPAQFFEPRPEPFPPYAERRGRAVLLSGCIMPLLYPQTMEATVRVLTQNGYEVVVPPGQVCCGALNVHEGERTVARDMARRNIDAFLAAEPDVIVTNSAGCGAHMKEYAELLHDDPAYAEKAERFASLVKDIHEVLVDLPFAQGLGDVPFRVTYQDSCHLAHAQRISKAPRDILLAIPGLELVEMDEATVCCGAAGSYTVIHRSFSHRLLRRKMQHVAATGADVVATANPGCMLQLQAGVRLTEMPARVYHVIDLLDEAYHRGETSYRE